MMEHDYKMMENDGKRWKMMEKVSEMMADMADIWQIWMPIAESAFHRIQNSQDPPFHGGISCPGTALLRLLSDASDWTRMISSTQPCSMI